MKTTLPAFLVVSVLVSLFCPSGANAAAPAQAQGFITFRTYAGDQRAGIQAGTAVPDGEFYPKRMEGPYNGYPGEDPGDDTTLPVDVRDTYNMQLIGYFYPPKTGKIQFAICTDDPGQLYLSTDASPANKVLVATETQWNPKRAFGGAFDPSIPSATRRSIITTGAAPVPRPENWTQYFQVTQGVPYYIEAVGTEFGGGDNTAVAFRYEGDPDFQDGDLPISGQYLSTIDKTLGPTSIKTQPQSQTVSEGTSVTFSVAADGTPPYTYQWKKGGTDITDATNNTYSIQFVATTDAGQYTVTVTGVVAPAATSNPATLTVNSDTTKPTIVSAAGTSPVTSPLGGITVVFSERVDAATAGAASSYGVSGGVTVSGATVLNATTVAVRTSTQTPKTVYTLTVNNVKDLAAVPNVIAANTTVQFNSAELITNKVQWQMWNGAISIDNLTNNLADGDYGRAPDSSWSTALFESGRQLGANYGARGYTWFKPPSNGDYVFYMTSDDNGRLFLSTDDNPANKKNIAAEATWSNNRDWTPAIGSEQASDSYADTQWPTGNTITLSASQYYYLEAQWQEGGGGDGCEVTFKKTADADPTSGDASLLTGSVVGLFADPSTRAPDITRRPTGTNYNKGDTLTFSVDFVSAKPVTFQWYRSKIAIPGATNNPYVIPNADYTAVGDYYVDVSNVNGTATSFPDDNVRAIMKGAFVIEAEDFNFNSGQTKAAASVMPYTGNAYLNDQTAVNNVDFFNTADESAGAAFAYNRFDVANPPAEVVDMKGGDASETADAIQNAINRDRGSFSVTANYAVGWTDKGEWQNYTRTFTDGTYVIIGGLAYDGRAAAQIDQYVSLVADPTKPDGSVAGAEGGLQGLTRVGVFKAPATGAWSSNDLIPLRDDNGNIVQVQLSGTKTLRWTANKSDGDQDFLLLYNIGGGGGGATISVSRNASGQPVITYTGTLQSASEVTGTFAPVTGATNPYTVTTTGSRQFYRSSSP